MSVTTTAVSTMNYLFLQTMIGKIDHENINEELDLFLYDLSNEFDAIQPEYVAEFKRELNEGPYFENISKAQARTLLDETIVKITSQGYSALTEFYLNLYDWNE